MSVDELSWNPLAKVKAEGEDIGRKQLHLRFLIRSSIRSRSRAEAKPHQEAEAYIKEATVVFLATSCNCGAERPWLRRIMRADLQVEARTRPAWSSTRDILVMKKKKM